MTLTPDDPRLLTPGPLTTSHETKDAMASVLREMGIETGTPANAA